MADDKFDRQRVGASESEPSARAVPAAPSRETELLYAIARLLAREAARDAFEKTLARDLSEVDQT